MKITGDLACMCKDMEDIYIVLESDGVYILKLLSVLEDECIVRKGSKYNLCDIRLATAEEIQEYLKRTN